MDTISEENANAPNVSENYAMVSGGESLPGRCVLCYAQAKINADRVLRHNTNRGKQGRMVFRLFLHESEPAKKCWYPTTHRLLECLLEFV